MAYWSTQAVLSIGTACGVLLVALDQLLISRFYRPLGYMLCGVPRTAMPASGKLEIVHTKVPVWLESGVLHLAEVIFCCYMASQWTWWLDFSEWSYELNVQDIDSAPFAAQERDEIAPFYMFYFGYVSFTFVRDIFLKEDRTGGNKLFTVHHILTYTLVATSFHFGEWRAGFLTRLLLGTGEVTLYLGKVYGAREQAGSGSRTMLGMIFLLNFVVWGGMRCCGYGYLCYSLTTMLARTYQPMTTMLFAACILMLVGSWTMLCLQLLWTPFILRAGVKFLRTGEMHDEVHHDRTKSAARCGDGSLREPLNASAADA